MSETIRGLQSSLGDFIKFCVIGVVTAGIQLAVFELLLLLHVNYQVSSFLGLFIATTLAYIGNRVWTFRSNNRLIRELLQFYATRAVTVPMNALLLLLLISVLHWDKILAQALTIGIIMIVNFSVGQKIVFKQR